MRNEHDKISAPLLIALHLLPGVIIGVAYIALSRIFIQNGLTGYLVLLITIPVCLVPIEIGVMLLWRARCARRGSSSATVGYRQRGTVIDYTALPFLLFICWGVLSFVSAPISRYLEIHLSGWFPAWATQESLINGLVNSPPTQRSMTIGLAVLLSGFVAPVVEELYFRGFLLSKMERWGWAAPIVHSLLFAMYHFYFPENVPRIFLVFIPISYVVMAKKNWRIGVVVHCLANLYGVYSLTKLIGR